MTLSPKIARFTLRTLLVVIAFCAIAFAWLADRTRLAQRHAAELAAFKEPHHYVLTVDGSPGMRLDMTLITKPARRTAQTITVPFSAKFDAVEASVWVDMLPDGQSGNDGDAYTITWSKDGRVSSRHVHGIRKDARPNVYINGTAHHVLGDF